MRNWQLFLDDERYPTVASLQDWTIARNYDDALWYVRNFGIPVAMSLDHDLGAPQNRTGMDFIKWFCDHIMDNNLQWNCRFTIHSMNPVGAQNMHSYLSNFVKDWYDSK